MQKGYTDTVTAVGLKGVSKAEALHCAEENGVEVLLDGNGVIGALASLPWFGRPEESIIPGTEIKPLAWKRIKRTFKKVKINKAKHRNRNLRIEH